MSYDLKALNPALPDERRYFHFGAFSWSPLLEACGYLWPCLSKGGHWYCVWGADPRMPKGDNYPRLLSNDGFIVTADEAKIMARVARNFVLVQRSLPEENRGAGTPATQMRFERQDVEAMLLRAMTDAEPNPWPVKIRDDFTEKYAQFAEWADQSGGFEIW
jgi:hypothetical protein